MATKKFIDSARPMLTLLFCALGSISAWALFASAVGRYVFSITFDQAVLLFGFPTAMIVGITLYILRKKIAKSLGFE